MILLGRRTGRFVLLSLAVIACGTGPTEPPAGILGRFDAFWGTFDAEYSYFEYKNINWDSLRTTFRPRAAAATSQDELVSILREMAAPLRDVHVRFITPAGVQMPTYEPAARMNWDRSVWDRTSAACGLTQVKPNLSYCTMNGVAYIMAGGWNDGQFSEADLDGVVDRFRDAPAMIIDVRPNGGGTDALAFALAGRFATASTVVGYYRFRSGPKHDDFGPETTRRIGPRGAFQFTRPVVVLAGRGAFSSNESFISAMRELPNVTILGDTTGGASANPVEHSLGDGWRYTVSRWIEWTADRQVIEWRGIPPDVHVLWDASAAALGRDLVLEAALARLAPPAGSAAAQQ
ncbi:MAG TPA: S41 family peptidase [Gemmatimonadaceae bacterium]|nr:S41 family peptidase [Gemmatimonadaceae bacterium]